MVAIRVPLKLRSMENSWTEILIMTCSFSDAPVVLVYQDNLKMSVLLTDKASRCPYELNENGA
jgi:hypothetical protein